MATLPTADDLSKPNGFRSGRDIAPGPTDYIGGALQNLGQSVQGLGEAMHARSQEQSAIDSANALAGFQTDAIKIDQKYRIENDPDYATYDKRSSADLEDSRNRWAGTIADPKRKAAFLASTQPDAAQHTATITNRGVALGKDKNIQDANTALDGLVNSALASNDPAVVNKSLAGVHDLIDQLEKTGAVTPGVAAQMRRERAQQYAKLSLESDAAADPTGTLAKVGLSTHEKDPGGDLTTQSAALLKHFEGFAGKASWDVDHHRLGYGSDTITTADGKVIEVKPGMTVTPEDAERDLNRRLPYAINSASETVGGNFFKLSTRAQAALVSLEYNYKNGLRNKALAGVVSAAQSGDPEALAKAIETLPAGSSNPEIAKGLKNRRAQEAAYIRGGTTDLSVSASDPRVALLAPEDIVSIRAQAASHAASQETAARAAQARQAADVKGSYELGIRTGELTDPTRFLNDDRIDDGDKATLMATFDAAFSEQKKTAAAIGRLQSGQTFQPYDSGDRADANRIYNAAGGSAGLVEGDAKASGGLQYVVDKTGVVPPDALTALRGAIAGPNASYAANAYKVAADLYQQNPRIFDAYDGGSDLAKAAEAYTHFTRDWGLDGAAAAARIQKAYSPETQRTAEALKPQTDAFVKGLDVHDIADKVGGGGFPVFGFGKPSEGATQGQAAAFAADVAEIGRQAFIDANGDAEAAKAATVAQVKGLYAVSNTSGHPALMRNAPELRYPPLGPGAGSRDYIRDEALKFAAQATGMPIAAPVPGAVDDTVSAADRGKPGVAGIALAATRETVRDFQDWRAEPALRRCGVDVEGRPEGSR
jgi:GH24 family phage-related lysozyme (muramidase)